MIRYNMDQYIIIMRDEDGQIIRRACVYARSRAAAEAMIRSKRGWSTQESGTIMAARTA